MNRITLANKALCQTVLSELILLLQDSVNSGASIGYVSTPSNETATQYWQEVAEQLESSNKQLLLKFEGNKVVGTVQLSICGKENGRHRAEVEKLMVHSEHRGKGHAKSLMTELEQIANKLKVKLLILDTKEGDAASFLYPKLGFQMAGKIPQFAMNIDGKMDATIYFYKPI